jgi:heptosyltransferase-2
LEESLGWATEKAMKKVRILVLRGGAIGDFLMTLPALGALRGRWPDAHIELVGYPRIACLAGDGALVDRVVSLDQAEVARLFALRAELSERQARYIRSFDVIVSYLYDPAGTVAENLRAAGARQVLYGDPRASVRHAVEQLFAPLAALALFPEGGERPRLTPGGAARARGCASLRAHGERVAVLHPGSGSPRKNWPLEKFLEVAEFLRRDPGLVPVFSFGEADAETRAALAARHPRAAVLEPLPLPELAGALAAAASYVGNDSGITHLAAAVGTPTVAVFGPSDPALWAPRGPAVAVVRSAEPTAESLRALPAAAVCAALRDLLGA